MINLLACRPAIDPIQPLAPIVVLGNSSYNNFLARPRNEKKDPLYASYVFQSDHVSGCFSTFNGRFDRVSRRRLILFPSMSRIFLDRDPFGTLDWNWRYAIKRTGIESLDLRGPTSRTMIRMKEVDWKVYSSMWSIDLGVARKLLLCAYVCVCVCTHLERAFDGSPISLTSLLLV